MSYQSWITENENNLDEWFKNHIAEFSDNKLIWHKPGTVTHRIVYLIDGPHLFVCGDYGEAVFKWEAGGTSFNFIAGCNYDYIAEKCKASEVGRSFIEFRSEEIEESLDEFCKDWDEDYKDEVAQFKESALSNMENEQDWNRFIADLHYGGPSFFDWEDLSALHSMGDVPNARFIAMIYGLKCAVRWLEEKAK